MSEPELSHEIFSIETKHIFIDLLSYTLDIGQTAKTKEESNCFSGPILFLCGCRLIAVVVVIKVRAAELRFYFLCQVQLQHQSEAVLADDCAARHHRHARYRLRAEGRKKRPELLANSLSLTVCAHVRLHEGLLPAVQPAVPLPVSPDGQAPQVPVLLQVFC